MKPRTSAILLVSCAVLFAGCATPSAPPPFLQSRLAPTWIASAQRIQSGERTIYYRGKARGANPADGASWVGTVSGEILALDPGMAIVIPTGTLTLTPDQRLSFTGQQFIITSDSPAWKHLLRPGRSGR